MLLNRFNFIVWGNTPPEPEHLSQLPLGGGGGRCSAAVLFIPGEELKFYLNAPVGLALSTSQITLVADNANLTVVEQTVGFLTPVQVAGLNQPQYIVQVSAPGGLVENYYRLRIGPAQFPYYSNRLWYRPTPDGVNDISAVFSFRSSLDLAFIPYEAPELAGFRNVLRLKCYAGNPQNEATVNKYNGVTTGRVRTTDIQQTNFRSFTVLDADCIADDGFKTMLTHRDLLVNGNKYSLKTAYAGGTDTSHLATGTFDLYETAFSLVARC